MILIIFLEHLKTVIYPFLPHEFLYMGLVEPRNIGHPQNAWFHVINFWLEHLFSGHLNKLEYVLNRRQQLFARLSLVKIESVEDASQGVKNVLPETLCIAPICIAHRNGSFTGDNQKWHGLIKEFDAKGPAVQIQLAYAHDHIELGLPGDFWLFEGIKEVSHKERYFVP